MYVETRKDRVIGSKLYLGRSVDACPSLSCWRAELPTAQTPPPLLSHLRLWQTVSGGEHTVLPGTSVLTQFLACLWACVCVCVCVCVCARACVPPPVHIHTPSRYSSPPSGLFSLWKSKPSHPSYSCYKRTQVCHFTKNPRAFGLATSPGHLISDWNYKSLFLCLFLETHLWHKKRWVCVKKRKKMDPEKTGVW